jgi:PBP1b-binding outer membrane lipoprotein LpoB
MKSHMKNLLMLAVVAGALFTPGCKKDDDGTEQEQINKVIVHLTGANGSLFNKEFEAQDPDGDGTWNTIQMIDIPAGTTFDTHIHVVDGTEEIDDEIEAESNDHLFTYSVTGANLVVTELNEDAAGNPFGMDSKWISGAASTGSIRIRLHHEPTNKNAADPGGEIDFEVSFPVTIQ